MADATATTKESSSSIEDTAQDKEKVVKTDATVGEEDKSSASDTTHVNGQKGGEGTSDDPKSKGDNEQNQAVESTNKVEDPANKDEGPSALEEKIIRQIEVNILWLSYGHVLL